MPSKSILAVLFLSLGLVFSGCATQVKSTVVKDEPKGSGRCLLTSMSAGVKELPE